MSKSPEQPMTPEGSNEARWKKEHTSLVESGKFDAIPMKPIKVGDMVAIRKNSLIHQVFEVKNKEAVVGYDLGDKHIRETIPLGDICDGASYQNALLEQRGVGHLYGTTVEGNVAKLWDKTKDN